MNELVPGTIVVLKDASELAVFEDAVAASINPNYASYREGAWFGRVALKELIRPPKFNGSISDITLESMAEPHARLLDLHERGLSLLGTAGGVGRCDDEEAANAFKGFYLSATPKSSRPGDLGQLQAEIWYGPPSEHTKNHGQPIRRFVTRPRFEAERFSQYHEASVRIGLTVLRSALKHPASGGLPNPR